MAPVDIDDVPLKEKHQQYNRIVKESIAMNLDISDEEFQPSDNNLENLKNIDIAGHKRNVKYILSVLKCGDMLYVSRALKQCPWLITDENHANIINTQYISADLQPYMSTKTFNKLIKHIRLTLDDETRAEEFYLNEQKPIEAAKWLPLCSVPFIEQNIEKHVNTLKIRLFKRLCEKSVTIFEIIMKHLSSHRIRNYLESVTFLLNTNIDLFVDILDNLDEYQKPNLSDKATELIMKHSPKRLIDKFEKYVACIHVPTFARHLEKEYVKTFLYEQAKKDFEHGDYRRMEHFWVNHLEYFIKRLPKDEQFPFVHQIFVEKVHDKIPEDKLLPDTQEYAMKKICQFIHIDVFDWFRYASFETAFEKFKALLSEEPDEHDEYNMLNMLLKRPDNSIDQMCFVLKYFVDHHKNADEYRKYEFVSVFIDNTSMDKYNVTIWKALQQFFRDLHVYEEDKDNEYRCYNNQFVDIVIVYHILQGTPIPSVVEKKFVFNTLDSYQAFLTEEQKEKVYNFLYNYLLTKFKENITNEEEFVDEVAVLKNFFELLSDWKKTIVDYPMIVNKIKELVHMKRKQSWKTDLSDLYNMVKKWRRHMFEESLVMDPNLNTCLNALKHQPSLLSNYNDEVHALRVKDNIDFGLFLAKLRVYYTNTIAKQWLDDYFVTMERELAHKALVRGICALLSEKPLLNMIENNAPKSIKIDWTNTDERTMSLQKHLAKNMHVARPQPSLDAVLLFAKGDYLQFALPSLIAILHNMSISSTRQHIHKILDARVSLQKHGIRFAYRKFGNEESKEIFFNCWKSSKNLSIRALIFKFTYKILCSEKDELNIIGLWDMMSMFIDTLSFEEDKQIYELLFEVEKVPLKVRADYLMKSYKFLKKFLPNAKSVHVNYESRLHDLAAYSREVIEYVDDEFITELINEFLEKEYYTSKKADGDMLRIISAYILCCKDVETQKKKKEAILEPILKHSLKQWDDNPSESNYFKSELQILLKKLSEDVKDFVVPKNMIVPTKMFSEILDTLVQHLSVPENYMLLTGWKLITELTKLVELTNGDDWVQIMTKIAPEIGNISLDYLKQDVEKHFPCIYLLFFKALQNYVIYRFLDNNDLRAVIYQEILSDKDFIQAYLAVMQFCHYDIVSNYNEQFNTVKELLSSNESAEVKFHYSNRIAQKSN